MAAEKLGDEFEDVEWLPKRHTNPNAAANIYLGSPDGLAAAFEVADQVRPQAGAVVRKLSALYVQRTLILSGDDLQAVAQAAEETGVTDFAADLKPDEKLTHLEQFATRRGNRRRGRRRSQRRAPCWAQADLGVAMGRDGTDAAVETADASLVRDDLSRIPWLIRKARSVRTTIRWNIALAIGAKLVVLVALLLGATNLWGPIAADVGATLAVLGNSLLLLRNSHGRLMRRITIRPVRRAAADLADRHAAGDQTLVPAAGDDRRALGRRRILVLDLLVLRLAWRAWNR